MTSSEENSVPQADPEELAQRISHWVAEVPLAPPEQRALSEHGFERLALAVFALQYRLVAPYRRLCEVRGARPETVLRWQDVPAVPVMAFKSLELHTAPAREIFRSSGTTGGPRSVHHHPFPDLYRRVIEATFPERCLVGLERPPILALVPTRQQMVDSSLGFMIDHVMSRFAGDDSIYAFGEGGVEVAGADCWLARRARDQRPGLVIATSLALAQWLDARATSGAAAVARLPPGSVLFDTGGFKGRRRELGRQELYRRVADLLGVPEERVVREYGMTELTSQLYTRTLEGGDSEHFVAPPWLRPRVLDPETLEELPFGQRGVVALFDLANVGSVAHLVTQDLGRLDGRGLRLEGRATGAELRGCSLTVEELEDGAGVGWA